MWNLNPSSFEQFWNGKWLKGCSFQVFPMMALNFSDLIFWIWTLESLISQDAKAKYWLCWFLSFKMRQTIFKWWFFFPKNESWNHSIEYKLGWKQEVNECALHATCSVLSLKGNGNFGNKQFMSVYDSTFCTRPASSDMIQTLLVCENVTSNWKCVRMYSMQCMPVYWNYLQWLYAMLWCMDMNNICL